MSRYTCSFRGNCELDEYGNYYDLPSCQQQCQGRENVDALLHIFDYSPLEGIKIMSPSERKKLLKKSAGVDFSDEEIEDIVLLLNAEDWTALGFFYTELVPLIRTVYDGRLIYKIVGRKIPETLKQSALDGDIFYRSTEVPLRANIWNGQEDLTIA